MEITPFAIEQYAAQHTLPENPILYALNRETHLSVLQPRMLSGHLQGTFLQFFSQLLQPLNILEIGTFTGYSAICLAQGLQANGILHTIDINEELYDIQRRYFDKAGLGTKIVSHVGNALDIIPTLPQTFDLIFIDADKQNYLNYYHLVLPKLRQGGYILADNVLWSGKVIEPKPDKDTEAIIAFNDAIANDPQVETLLLPLRDGILIARKK